MCERHFLAPANSGTGYLTPSGPRQKQNATRFSLDSQNSPSGWTHVGQASPPASQGLATLRQLRNLKRSLAQTNAMTAEGEVLI